jgi:LPPG:FO 2-phospho-L-lactate transferase
MKIVAFAGGVGGAKLIDGLVAYLSPEELTIIVNTGDDFDHLGFHICPDLDTICYTLAGLENSQTGWGRENESWNFLTGLKLLGGPDWFQIGDKDLITHVERTRRLKQGQPLSTIVREFCSTWNIQYPVIPMSDDLVSTIIDTREFGEINFQDYFVCKNCEPEIKNIRFEGINTAAPAPGMIDAISKADVLIICPSNPWVSIDPILSIKGVLSSIDHKPIIAISPIVEGKAIKGPAAKMYSELGITPSAFAVANHYKQIINAIVIDSRDSDQINSIETLGIIPYITNTIMRTYEDRLQVARDVLNFIKRIV